MTQISAFQLRTAQIGALKVGKLQVCTTKIDTMKAASAQVSAAEICTTQIQTAEVSIREDPAAQTSRGTNIKSRANLGIRHDIHKQVPRGIGLTRIKTVAQPHKTVRSIFTPNVNKKSKPRAERTKDKFKPTQTINRRAAGGRRHTPDGAGGRSDPVQIPAGRREAERAELR